jgi:alpha-glucosidase
MDKPARPLELHIYPGEGCRGEIYADDGIDTNGPSLRQSVECSVVPGGVALSFNEREGSFKPWWNSIALVVHGGARETRKIIPDQPRANKMTIALAK